MKSKLYLLMAMAAMHQNDIMTPKQCRRPTKEKSLPPGCQKYYFAYGAIVSLEFAEIAEFSCVARNEKGAIRKYENFKKQQTDKI